MSGHPDDVEFESARRTIEVPDAEADAVAGVVRCTDCRWVHEANSVAKTSFMGVELCPRHTPERQLIRLTKLPAGFYRMAAAGDTFATILALDPPSELYGMYHIHFDHDSTAEPNVWTIEEGAECDHVFTPISEEDACEVSPQLMRHLADIDGGHA